MCVHVLCPRVCVCVSGFVSVSVYVHECVCICVCVHVFLVLPVSARAFVCVCTSVSTVRCCSFFLCFFAALLKGDTGVNVTLLRNFALMCRSSSTGSCLHRLYLLSWSRDL